MFIRIKRTGVYIDIRIKFLDGNSQSLACNNLASEAAIIPLPKEEVTPPVTKIYLAIINGCMLSAYVVLNLVKMNRMS